MNWRAFMQGGCWVKPAASFFLCEGHKEKEDKKDRSRTYSVRKTLDSPSPAWYIIYVVRGERERMRTAIATLVALAFANAATPMRGEVVVANDADAASMVVRV